MHRASSGVVWQSTEINCFINNALSSKRSVSVDQQAHNFFSLVVVQVSLLGSGFAFDDWVNSLQVTRVGQKRQVNFLSVSRLSVIRGSKVIFHITRSSVGSSSLRRFLSCEFVEDGFKWFSDNVGKSVKTPSVSHAHNDIFHSKFSGSVNQSFNSRDQGFASVQSKTFGNTPLLSNEKLKVGAPEKSVENYFLVFFVVGILLWCFDSVTQPVAHLSVLNMHVLKTNRSAICLF
mmetsp:Transcript_23765/g.33284  ORF Transcript_23765/g.33284 Transcript_23765/m.33284 type:complete len:233 (-) Transcript_23765:852-1550(-)